MIKCMCLSRDEKIRQSDRQCRCAIYAVYGQCALSSLRWVGVACVHDPRQQRQLIKGSKLLRFMQ